MSNSARIAGSGVAGLTELTLFHPIDTVAKRLMASKETVTRDNYQSILFQDKAVGTVPQKFRSLFPGLGYGALYKVSQRIYKFGGQPYVNELLVSMTSGSTGNKGGFWTNGISGALVGAGEVMLLPFDTLKIKCQTNAEYRKLPVTEIIRREGGFLSLYAGASYTAARNVMGSFMLFGVNSVVKNSRTSNDGRAPSLGQILLSSTAGSISSILIACPLDVVKTRIQSGNFKGQSGMDIIRDIIKNEGLGGFFKGAVPKVFTVGPKLIFSFTLAQYLTNIIEKSL
jgi:hypothetical protein